MNKLPLNMLRTYAAIFETGGVRPAARRLEVSHSSVSKFLGELEAWLGTHLVERSSTGRIEGFTREGQALGNELVKSFSNINQVIASIRERSGANTVSVEMTPSFASRWLLPRLGQFEEKHPNIDLSIVVDQRVRNPSDDGVDLSIRLGEGPWKGLNCTPLMDDALYPVMRQDYWVAFGGSSDPKILTKMRLLHDRNPKAAWSVWADAMKVSGLNTLEGPRYSSLDLVLRAAEQGLGVALARHQFARDSVDSGMLIKPFGDVSLTLPNSIWIVEPGHGLPRSAVRVVKDWLLEEASKEGGS